MQRTLHRSLLALFAACTLAAAPAVVAQTLELPYEVDFTSKGLGNSLDVIVPDAQAYDVSLGKLVGATVRVDIERTCGETLYTNHTRATKQVNAMRNLQISVANLATGVVLTSRLPASTGNLPVQLEPNTTATVSECGGAATLVFTNLPIGPTQHAIGLGVFGLDIEVTPAPPPAGVTLERYATLIEGRVSVIWHFEPGPGNGAAGWTGVAPWSNLHQGLAGHDDRIPSLMGSGALKEGEFYTLVLFDAPVLAPAYLIGGGSVANLPFKGGVMVPFPNIRIPMDTSDEGAIVIAKRMPQHVALAGTYTLQFWIEDAAGPEGFSASNAISGVSQ